MKSCLFDSGIHEAERSFRKQSCSGMVSAFFYLTIGMLQIGVYFN